VRSWPAARAARGAVDHLLQLVFLAVVELEVVRVGHHAGEVHAGAELLGVAEADRQQFPLMHDGGGGVAGTEVDAEAHGEFRGDQGRALCCSSPPTASSCGLLFRRPDRVMPAAGRCRKRAGSRAVTMAAVDSL
jgi:hypothetical protein